MLAGIAAYAREAVFENPAVEGLLDHLADDLAPSSVQEVSFSGVRKALAQRLHRALDRPGPHEAILGLKHIDKIIDIDQSPIGRTPRSNPATYSGLFTPIREFFAQVPEARLRWSPSPTSRPAATSSRRSTRWGWVT